MYAFAVLLAPMQAELGLSRAEVSLAASIALATSAVAGVGVGWLMDRRDPRLVMTAGSVLATASVLAWSRVQSAAALFAVFAVLGVAMAAVTYGPAFTGARQALRRAAPHRRAHRPHRRRGVREPDLLAADRRARVRARLARRAAGAGGRARRDHDPAARARPAPRPGPPSAQRLGPRGGPQPAVLGARRGVRARRLRGVRADGAPGRPARGGRPRPRLRRARGRPDRLVAGRRAGCSAGRSRRASGRARRSPSRWRWRAARSRCSRSTGRREPCSRSRCCSAPAAGCRRC